MPAAPKIPRRLSDLNGVVLTSYARGDLLYFNGTNLVNLATGTSGYVLTSQGAGADPSWQAAGGGGSPGGGDTQIQFNGSGVFAGSSNLYWDGNALNVQTDDANSRVGLIIRTPSGAIGAQIDGYNGQMVLNNYLSVPLIQNPNYGWYLGNSNWKLASDLHIAWTPSGYYDTPDVGITRSAANVLKITDGSTGGGIIEFPAVSSLGTPTSGSGRMGVISGEVNVEDSSGNVSVISPHAKDAPAELYRLGPGVDAMRRTVNHMRGTVLFITADGRDVWETFAEYNARRPEAPLAYTDWDDVEVERVERRQSEREEWQGRKDAHDTAHAVWLAQPEDARGQEPVFAEPEPESYTAQERPEWAHLVTREEIDAWVPVSVMAHQLRVQLIVEGIDPDSVTSAVAAIEDSTTRKIAAAQWEYAPTIRRDHPLVLSLAARLSLSTASVDEIFRQAAKL